MWKAILQVKDATQNRARNDDSMWAARDPKVVMTTNCDNLDDWIGVMFRSAKSAHKEAIRLRTAEVQPIENSLYVSGTALIGSSSFLPSQMSSEAAREPLASLFE